MPLSAEFLEDVDEADAPSAKTKRPAVRDDDDEEEEEELGSVSEEEDDDDDGESVESEKKVGWLVLRARVSTHCLRSRSRLAGASLTTTMMLLVSKFLFAITLATVTAVKSKRGRKAAVADDED